MAKLIILVLDADNEPIYQTGRELWRATAQKYACPIFFLRATPSIQDDTLYIEGDTLSTRWIGNADHWVHMMAERINNKNIKGLQYCLENFEFDYILRTNLSSFYRLDVLLNFLETAPRKLFYGGPQNTLPIPIEGGRELLLNYVSGSGILLSRDLIPALLYQSQRIPLDSIDDIWMGLALKTVRRQSLARCDFEDVHDLSSDHILKVVQRIREAERRGTFHFRIKNSVEDSRFTQDSLIFGMLAARYLA